MVTESRKMKATGLVTNEVQNGATLARSYDFLGRPTGYALCGSASLREITFTYDLLGRLATVASGTNLFTYSYLLGTDLVSGYTCGGFSRTVAYEPYRDLVSAITNRFGSRVISTFEYTNDAAGRRTAIKRGGDAMGPLSGATDAYGYNGRNEVVSARRTLGGSPVAGFDEDFAYDPIGNRVSSTDYDETGAARTSTYTANSLNQYTSRTVPGWASVRGLADADATVAVNGNLAYALASGDLAYFFGSDDFDNSVAGGFAELEVSAAMSDATNDFVSVVTNRVFIPPANETYAYDADGNQTLVTTGTGEWQVEYNGENRPVRWTCGDKTILMTFDHQGRRRLYVEVAAGVTNKLHRFTYDDYVCIVRNREVDAQHGVGSDAFVWDPTEPIATRPLMCNPSTETPFFYCHDGNKNVSEAVSLYGTIAAHYEYSSFGKVVLVTSENESQATANLNPYRFSSEYADDATRLVYYNFRHYNPRDGRWAQRDPAEDILTFQAYVMSQNDCLRYPDVLGLFDDGYDDVCVETKGGWERDDAGHVIWVETCVRWEKRPSAYKGHAQFPNNGTKCPFDYTAEDYGWTSPFNPFSLYRHFKSKSDIIADLKNSIDKCDADAFQSYMHQYQDTYVHYENGYTVWTFGHAFALTNPDNDDEAWENASQATQGFVNGWNNACKLKCPSNCEAGWERR